MPKNTQIIPNAPVLRIMKSSGAPRVSKPAVSAMSTHIYSFAQEIARQAVALSKHAKRSTVLSSDLQLSGKK